MKEGRKEDGEEEESKQGKRKKRRKGHMRKNELEFTWKAFAN